MPSINVDVKHSLDKKEATERVKSLLNELRSKYGSMVQNLSENWNEHDADFSFKAMGMAVNGSLVVDESSFKMNGKIPLTAMPFKKTIEEKIRQEAEELLKN